MLMPLCSTRSLVFVVTFSILGTVTADRGHAQWNPIVWDSGQHVSGISYDPFTGRIRVRTDHRKIRESALDPNRQDIDPGSYERVDEYQTDAQGRRWRVTGYRWTSNGVPHGNLNRQRVSSNGGIDHDENENVIYSPTVGSQRSIPKNRAKKTPSVRRRGDYTPSWTRTKPGRFRPLQPQHRRTPRHAAPTYNPFLINLMAPGNVERQDALFLASGKNDEARRTQGSLSLAIAELLRLLDSISRFYLRLNLADFSPSPRDS